MLSESEHKLQLPQNKSPCNQLETKMYVTDQWGPSLPPIFWPHRVSSLCLGRARSKESFLHLWTLPWPVSTPSQLQACKPSLAPPARTEWTKRSKSLLPRPICSSFGRGICVWKILLIPNILGKHRLNRIYIQEVQQHEFVFAIYTEQNARISVISYKI